MLFLGGTKLKRQAHDACLYRIKKISAFDASYEGIVIDPETGQKDNKSLIEFENDSSSYHGHGNLFFDGFMSAGGKNSNGQIAGVDLPRVWQSLLNADAPVSPLSTTKIHVNHIPDITAQKVTNLEQWILDNNFIKLPHVWKSLTNSETVVTPTSTTKIHVNHIPDITVSKVSDIETWIDGKGYALDASLSDYLKKEGGTMTGALHMGSENGASPYIYWGDGTRVYIGEDTDDHMVIRASDGIEMKDAVTMDKLLTLTAGVTGLGFDIGDYVKKSDLFDSNGKIKSDLLPS